MGYLDSGAVYMFPSANRGGTYLTSKLNTEYNLVSIINRLTSQDSFVISDDVLEEGSFAFNIGGYYFSIEIGTLKKLLENSSGYLKAQLKLEVSEPSPTNGLGPYIKGDTQDGKFEGVSFEVVAEMETNSSTTLYLLYKDSISGVFSIPAESKIRMRTSSTQRYISIDDGDLD